MINWQYFPKSSATPQHMQAIVSVFEKHNNEIDSEKHTYDSNGVLEIIRIDLEKNGYEVETSKKKEGKIHDIVVLSKILILVFSYLKNRNAYYINFFSVIYDGFTA